MSDRDARFSENTDMSQQPSPPVDEVSPVQGTQPSIQTSVSTQPKTKMLTRMHNKLGRLHLFAAFCENPINVSFQTQEEDEHVLLFLRKSQWVNASWILTSFLLLFVPPVLYFFRNSFLEFIPDLKVVLVLIPFYYLLVALYAFSHFITWYYNAALITDKRVIDIDFHQIVLKDVSETKLALVQDVSYKQDGVLPNIFGYGFILIQTAGALENFEFYNMPQPARIVEVVEALIGGRRFYEP